MSTITAITPRELTIDDDRRHSVVWQDNFDTQVALKVGAEELDIYGSFTPHLAEGGVLVIGHDIDGETITEVYTHPCVGSHALSLVERSIETLQTLAEGLRRASV